MLYQGEGDTCDGSLWQRGTWGHRTHLSYLMNVQHAARECSTTLHWDALMAASESTRPARGVCAATQDKYGSSKTVGCRQRYCKLVGAT